MDAKELYHRCTTGRFEEAAYGVDYRVETINERVYCFFQGTIFPEGARKWADVLVDMDCRPVRSMGKWYLNGFNEALNKSIEQVLDATLEDRWAHAYGVTYAGFSLGGAMAEMFADDSLNPSDRAITFGAPCTRWGLKLKRDKRITQFQIPNDPVVWHAPVTLGYYHPGVVKWLPWSKGKLLSRDPLECTHMMYADALEKYNG